MKKIPKKTRQKILWSTLAVSFVVFEVLLFFYIDRPLALFMELQDSLSHNVIQFFRVITDLGKAIWYLVPCGFAVIFCAFVARGHGVPQIVRRLCAYVGVRALFIFLAIALSGIAADVMKPIFGRARPALWLHDNIYGFAPFTMQGFSWNSTPSGHTTTVFALACSLTMLYPRLRIIWFAYALLIAVSRVAVDAHYLSDVCAGAVLGWLTVRLFAAYGMNRIWKVIFPIDIPAARR